MQKGEDDASVAAARKEFEKAQAALARKTGKAYYRVTVKVLPTLALFKSRLLGDRSCGSLDRCM